MLVRPPRKGWPPAIRRLAGADGLSGRGAHRQVTSFSGGGNSGTCRDVCGCRNTGQSGSLAFTRTFSQTKQGASSLCGSATTEAAVGRATCHQQTPSTWATRCFGAPATVAWCVLRVRQNQSSRAARGGTFARHIGHDPRAQDALLVFERVPRAVLSPPLSRSLSLCRSQARWRCLARSRLASASSSMPRWQAATMASSTE